MSVCMWNSERQNKTKTKLKNTHTKYLEQFRSLFSQPSRLHVTFCRTVHTQDPVRASPMLWYEAFWVAGVA